MKKTLLILCFIFGATQITNAQIDFGVKAGINYNSDSFIEVKTDVFDGAKSKTGFHAGIWTRFKLPVVGLYIRPELVYTSLKSELKEKESTKTADYNFQKIDIPVLLGKKFGGVVNVFVGPSFQYIIDSSSSTNIKDIIDDIKDSETNGFSVGVQLGAGVEFGSLGLDVRWERAFSDTESKFLANNVSDNFNFDTRVNQIIIGLSYKF